MNTIEKFLEEDDDDRPTVREINDSINNIASDTIKELNMTLNDTHMN